MAVRLALGDYQKYQPDKCEKGICQSALVYRFKLLKQEKSYDVPMPD